MIYLTIRRRSAYISLVMNIRSVSDENLGCLSAIIVSGQVEGSPSILKYMDEIHYQQARIPWMDLAKYAYRVSVVHHLSSDILRSSLQQLSHLAEISVSSNILTEIKKLLPKFLGHVSDTRLAD